MPCFTYYNWTAKTIYKTKHKKTKTIGPSLFTLIYFPDVGLSVCPFFRIFVCSLISHELLDKTYIYAYHQNGLNEEIKIMCFICRFNVYFSHNHRKCSQNGEDENLKFMRQIIYHLARHEILNITVCFVFHFNVYLSRKWRKCSQNLEKWKFKNTNLRVKRYIL